MHDLVRTYLPSKSRFGNLLTDVVYIFENNNNDHSRADNY